jgi:hypothetical protein
LLGTDSRPHDINQRQIKQKRGRQHCQTIERIISPKSVDEANSRKQDPKRNDDELSHKATHRADAKALIQGAGMFSIDET